MRTKTGSPGNKQVVRKPNLIWEVCEVQGFLANEEESKEILTVPLLCCVVNLNYTFDKAKAKPNLEHSLLY